jgi:type III secretion system YscI/HrpB-like protein
MSPENVNNMLAMATLPETQPAPPSDADVNAFQEAMKAGASGHADAGTAQARASLDFQKGLGEATLKIDVAAKVAGKLSEGLKQLYSMQ